MLLKRTYLIIDVVIFYSDEAAPKIKYFYVFSGQLQLLLWFLFIIITDRPNGMRTFFLI